MAKKTDDVLWVITPDGDLVQCVGCKIDDPDHGMYGKCYLNLSLPGGKSHLIVSDRHWSGKSGPVPKMVQARELITQGIIKHTRAGTTFDMRENLDLINLIDRVRAGDTL